MRPALRAQTEGDVLDRAQVGKEDVILEHEAGSPALCGYVDAKRAVVQDLAVENHSAFHLVQARQRSQQGGLARPVGTKHRDRLVRSRGQLDVEREAIPGDSYRGLERHTPSHRSRRPTRIATETTSRIRLSVIAASGFVSSAR